MRVEEMGQRIHIHTVWAVEVNGRLRVDDSVFVWSTLGFNWAAATQV